MGVEIDLGGQGWEFGRVEPSVQDDDYLLVQEWLPASVPGGLHADLATLGQILPPFFADNLEASRWVEDHDWWYRTSFTRTPGEFRTFLDCDGIDYRSTIYVNGHNLGPHEGMFAPRSYDVTDLLQDDNLLAIRIAGPRHLPRLKRGLRQQLERFLARVLLQAELYPDRFASLKCQMSYGWDFAPHLPNLGIWDDIRLRQTGDVSIQRLRVSAAPTVRHARIDVSVDLDARAPGEATALLEIEDAQGQIAARQLFPLSLPSGDSTHQLTLGLERPILWQPWDRGEPHLYRARFIVQRAGVDVDSREESFGVRSVRLMRGKGVWSLHVNEDKEFLRGANWVPGDAVYGRLREADYARLIGQAKEAHINILRVWGGGLREKRAFYDLCDREGILVWQEFPFACAFFDRFPRNAEYMQLVRRESQGIVDLLFNHPSVALWCGGNEFNPRRNRHIVDTLRSALSLYQDTRPFVAASPGHGDAHNWRVWHGWANVRDYRRERKPLLSEFGLQSLPELSTLTRFLPEHLLSGESPEFHVQRSKLSGDQQRSPEDTGLPVPSVPPSALSDVEPPTRNPKPETRNPSSMRSPLGLLPVTNWVSHLRARLRRRQPPDTRALLQQCGVEGELEHLLRYHCAELDKLARYAEAYGPTDLLGLIRSTQRAQAQGLQVAIEHYRRRRDQAGGVLVWQLNEPWPAVSWSLIDYYGTPKEAYRRLQELYNPLLVSLDYALRAYRAGDSFAADVWVINDWDRAFQASVLSCRHAGEEVWRRQLDVPANALLLAGRLEFTVAAPGTIDVELTTDGTPLSHNSYDLTYHDSRTISTKDALRNWITWHALET